MARPPARPPAPPAVPRASAAAVRHPPAASGHPRSRTVAPSALSGRLPASHPSVAGYPSGCRPWGTPVPSSPAASAPPPSLYAGLPHAGTDAAAALTPRGLSPTGALASLFSLNLVRDKGGRHTYRSPRSTPMDRRGPPRRPGDKGGEAAVQSTAAEAGDPNTAAALHGHGGRSGGCRAAHSSSPPDALRAAPGPTRGRPAMVGSVEKSAARPPSP